MCQWFHGWEMSYKGAGETGWQLRFILYFGKIFGKNVT